MVKFPFPFKSGLGDETRIIKKTWAKIFKVTSLTESAITSESAAKQQLGTPPARHIAGGIVIGGALVDILYVDVRVSDVR